MFRHCWRVRAFERRKALLGTLLWAAMILLEGLGASGSALADNHKQGDKTGEVDTEHMFGFTEGSDIGEKGETEVEAEFDRPFRQAQRLLQQRCDSP